MSTTDAQIAQITARAGAATRQPWTWEDHRVPNLMGRGGDPDTYEYDVNVIEFTHSGECGCRSACQLELTISDSDKDFIAHARADIVALLDKITEFEIDRKQLVDEHRDMRNQLGDA